MAERLGNRMLKLSLELISCCIKVGTHWSLGNRATSLLFLMPGIRNLERRRLYHSVVFDQCEFGLEDPVSHKRYKKATRVISSFSLDSLRVRCSQDHEHEPVVGAVKVGNHWTRRSKLAGAYPWRLRVAWARAIKLQLVTDHQHRCSRPKGGR